MTDHLDKDIGPLMVVAEKLDWNSIYTQLIAGDVIALCISLNFAVHYDMVLFSSLLLLIGI